MHISSLPLNIFHDTFGQIAFQFHGDIICTESGGFQYSDPETGRQLFLNIIGSGDGFYQCLADGFPSFFQFPSAGVRSDGGISGQKAGCPEGLPDF